MINFAQAAVLVINVQVDFCSAQGFAAKLGRDITRMQGMLGELRAFLKAARQAELPIVFCQYIARKDLSPTNIRINKDREEKARMCLLDSRGSELYRLFPKDHDGLVKHRFYDAFAKTELKDLLRDLKVKTLLLTGVRTELSVDATAKRAISEGFEVVLVEDLISTYGPKQSQERHLLEVFDRYYGYVMNSVKILEQLD